MTVKLELLDKQEATLKAKAQAHGMSAEEYVQHLLDRDLDESDQQPVSAMFREIWSGMPDEVRAKLPADGLNQIDHYVYGVPKSEQ